MRRKYIAFVNVYNIFFLSFSSPSLFFFLFASKNLINTIIATAVCIRLLNIYFNNLTNNQIYSVKLLIDVWTMFGKL